MCQSIVGSEEHFKTIRMMNTCRDYLKIDNCLACITSGSFGEGLEMKGSDIDIMRKIKLIEVYEDPNNPCNPYKICFAMATYDTQPGFTLLRLLNIDRVGKSFLCNDKGSDVFLANNTIKCLSLSKLLPNVHGPCLSDEKGFFDFATCLHCKSWIAPAMKWITRPNNGWPGEHLTPEKFQPFMKLSHVHNELLNLSIFRNMNIAKLMKFKMVDYVYFGDKSLILPAELQTDGTMPNYTISPVVYAHFLCFLCHYHLNNTRQCRDSLQDLQLTIEENYFITNAFDTGVSYNILGKAFQLIGDKLSAKWAFMNSIIFKLDPHLVSLLRNL
ncbi:unnamed protein product [Mytilus coruscus]|uniref:Mab-21-like nucleotidyltransferase domain-containing protein n=1 Tax=Mytilus coruscus TaxID=42192 RepID=A0A6J8BXN7_MYTCO|nr:unnamed protein product [Mytilus coruscus]